ncbi:cucumber peeling cupredoxin-like [Zingiber officinale]|uniref:Phytocyanin domain-containing protein n=1 Tax=Zingiber officinale TaxID=94328 RepID=A0A8J5IG74_ZINOF|nr:cucumber peeling cupredoxin-like [Zingiber officinale]XP_042453260.1 cucumber peeling cupredoxin-like [Zingiber officinale]KAG6533509.1 hypothetical protein ZIOFF_007384 [Zingiber officinale]
MVEGHSRHVAFFLMAAMGFLSTSAAHHKTHIVGGSYGWRIPNTTTFYQDWADARDFAVGDKIVFLFTTMVQNVVELSSAEDFAACTTNNVIDIHFKGPTILELTAAGQEYYLCNVGLHCEKGQKLSINVSSTPHPDVRLA